MNTQPAVTATEGEIAVHERLVPLFYPVPTPPSTVLARELPAALARAMYIYGDDPSHAPAIVAMVLMDLERRGV